MIDENKVFFTHHQFERAKRARDLYHALGMPSTIDLRLLYK
jgi:hypothetical protein